MMTHAKGLAKTQIGSLSFISSTMKTTHRPVCTIASSASTHRPVYASLYTGVSNGVHFDKRRSLPQECLAPPLCRPPPDPTTKEAAVDELEKTDAATLLVRSHGALGIMVASIVLAPSPALAIEPPDIWKNTQVVVSVIGGIIAGVVGGFNLRGLNEKRFSEKVNNVLTDLPETAKGKTILANLGYSALQQEMVQDKTDVLFKRFWNNLLEDQATVALIEKRAQGFFDKQGLQGDIVEIKEGVKAISNDVSSLKESQGVLRQEVAEIRASLARLEARLG